jgi:hypothetical protein
VFDNVVLKSENLGTALSSPQKKQKKDDWREGVNEEEQTQQPSEVA